MSRKACMHRSSALHLTRCPVLPAWRQVMDLSHTGIATHPAATLTVQTNCDCVLVFPKVNSPFPMSKSAPRLVMYKATLRCSNAHAHVHSTRQASLNVSRCLSSGGSALPRPPPTHGEQLLGPETHRPPGSRGRTANIPQTVCAAAAAASATDAATTVNLSIESTQSRNRHQGS